MITMRADSIIAASSCRACTITASRLIADLSRQLESLLEMMTKPAERAGIIFEEGLPELILESAFLGPMNAQSMLADLDQASTDPTRRALIPAPNRASKRWRAGY